MHKPLTHALVVLGLVMLPIAGRAGMTDREKALWGASAEAPTTFAIPVGQDKTVMAQALVMIQNWPVRDQYMYPMPLRIQTDSLIQTAEPTALNLFGFKITDTHSAGVALISVETTAYEGKIFQVSQQHRDASKRAHLLAYLLEQTAGVSTVSLPPTIPPPPTGPTVTVAPTIAPTAPSSAGTFGPSLEHLRSQLDGGDYDAALATLDALRGAILARKKGSTP